MKPKGQTQPQRDLPSNMPIIRNEAIASQGKTKNPVFSHPPSINCRAVKASPTVFGSSPQVHRTGSKRGNAPKLKITALKKMKDKN